ncbi:hypothetical protein [Verrucomicrobium sp. BvORR106]|uniref:hypothetical protein n=1 Tax=Verrucomicrobium sp. BvORR106 TaxID=1403819 RepID=UPI00056EC10C|nr:hypothetical protein [Verrucomicrobium sp. BvORR106]
MKALDEPETALVFEPEGDPPPAATETQPVVEYGARSDPLPAADALAWSLLGLLAFCALCFLAGALTLRHRERHPAPSEEDDEDKPVILPRTPKRPPDDESPRQPWERDGDWWKKP